ncbi:MAG: hypothetical protein ACRDL5_15970 [Solirubrobacteraceae bacterium]
MPEPSLIDAHLAEIDRRLRVIQSGLEPQARATVPPPAVASAVLTAVSAGPFDGLGALARFERALSELPGVLRVRLREYEGADRAVYEVLLDAAIS